MEHVIVERVYDQPVDAELVRASGNAKNGCFAVHRVRWLRSSLSLDGTRMICEYEAPDAESVRRAQDSAGLRYERIWTARSITP